MRARVLRVRSAEVVSNGELLSRIARGLLVRLGVGMDDTAADAELLAEKIASLRIFEGADGRINLSVRDVGGDVLAISNCTLRADVRKGRRPSIAGATAPDAVELLCDAFVASLGDRGCRVARCTFGRNLEITSVADESANLVVQIPPRRLR